MTVFNWLLGINFFTFLLHKDLSIPSAAFLIPAIILLAFELMHFGFNLTRGKPKQNTFYRGLNGSDVVRMYSALAVAIWVHGTSTYNLSMLLFVIVALVVVIAIYVICLDLLREKKATVVTIVGLLCLYVLCGWLKTLYISQYGTREFGHWLERPNYFTVVPATVHLCDQEYTCHEYDEYGEPVQGESVQAYIEVTNGSSYEDSGYDDTGSFEDYRYIQVYKFVNTVTGEVNYMKASSSYLEFNGSGYVGDDFGRSWSLYINNYRQ